MSAGLPGGAVPTVEEHVGAPDELAFVVADPVKFARIGRGGQPDVDGVEVPQRGAVRVVDGAVALVGDDEIEVGVAETAWSELARDGFQRADDDLAFEACCRRRAAWTASRAGSRQMSPSPAWPVRSGRRGTGRGKSMAAWNHRFMSIAMVSVLPVPVAISKSIRRRPAINAVSALDNGVGRAGTRPPRPEPETRGRATGSQRIEPRKPPRGAFEVGPPFKVGLRGQAEMARASPRRSPRSNAHARC